MAKIRSAINYINQIKSNKIDHGDIVAIKLAKIMAVLRLWWTTEYYKQASAMDKFICFSCCAAYFGTFLIFFIYINQFREDQPLTVYLGNLSCFLVTLLDVFGFILFHIKRDVLSMVIQDVNEKNWIMLRRFDSMKYRSQRNTIHLICIGMLSCELVMAFILGLSLILEFMATGEDHFTNHFTANSPPYSLRKLVNCLFHIVQLIWVIAFFVPIFTMIVEIFLIISLNYCMLADDLRQIEIGKDEIRIFKGLMKELNDLQRLIKSMNEILWSLWTLYITLLLYILGFFLSIILTMDSVMEALFFAIMPVILFSYMAIFCVIGQHVKDSAAEVRKAAYNCEWPAAPTPFQKLILMLLLRCEQESKLDAKPFFEMDLARLAKIMQSTYAIMAIVLNISR